MSVGESTVRDGGSFLEDLDARGLARPEFVIVDEQTPDRAYFKPR